MVFMGYISLVNHVQDNIKYNKHILQWHIFKAAHIMFKHIDMNDIKPNRP